MAEGLGPTFASRQQNTAFRPGLPPGRFIFSVPYLRILKTDYAVVETSRGSMAINRVSNQPDLKGFTQ